MNWWMAPLVQLRLLDPSDLDTASCPLAPHGTLQNGVFSLPPTQFLHMAGPIGTDATSSADGVTASAPIQADAADLGSCVAMAKQAKVVIACAGPFALMGEAVIA